MPTSSPDERLLREVKVDDLAVFFDHQRDPAALGMASMPARDAPAFDAHWSRILDDDSVIAKTVVVGGRVAGYVVSFEQADRRLVGYWIGREFWGRGLATRALAELVAEIRWRPLHAHVVKDNLASIRVLEKCGFRRRGAFSESSGTDDGERVALELWELRR